MQNDLRRLKLVAFDFDGIFTDNKVYVDQDGRETICCTRSDGIGLSRLRGLGIGLVVISAEVNPVVQKRCAKLKLRCISGCEDKLKALKDIMAEDGLGPEEVCFVGNDLPDLDCLRFIGFPIAVSDGYPEVLSVAKYVTKAKGGHGAVREICDLIFRAHDGGKQ